ncbi:MAG: hypothetical protein ACLR8Y_19745 [Alistipes indistinctus]
MAKEIGQRLLDNSPAGTALRVIQSDGSYLFNFKIAGPYSYPDLLLFCQMLARNKGVATVPYPTGPRTLHFSGRLYLGIERGVESSRGRIGRCLFRSSSGIGTNLPPCVPIRRTKSVKAAPC